MLTLSSSSTVRAALLGSADRGVRVICLEGRPMNEGQAMAGALARAGIPVVYAVDAAGWCVAHGADCVVMGADSVGDLGVVNKIGTAALVAAARDRGLPVHLLVDRTKLLPPGFPQPIDDDRPSDEVWRAPPGVRVWNRYFESVPLDVLTSVVLEEDVLTSAQTQTLRRGFTVPAELRRWAAQRSAPPGPEGNGGRARG